MKGHWFGATAVCLAAGLGVAAGFGAPVPSVPAGDFSWTNVGQTLIVAALLYIGRWVAAGVKSVRTTMTDTAQRLDDHQWRIELIETHVDEGCANCKAVRRQVYRDGLVPDRRGRRRTTTEIPFHRREEDQG